MDEFQEIIEIKGKDSAEVISEKQEACVAELEVKISGETWYTIHQLSRMIDRTSMCIHNWEKAGKVEKTKVDGSNYYRLAKGMKVIIG